MKHVLAFASILCVAAFGAIVQYGPPVPTLINGIVADMAEWPASVSVRSGNAGCTGTVVGPRVLFHAAHCVGNGGTSTFRAGGASYSARCEHSPNYRGNSTADWTLCLTSQPVQNVAFENINTDPELVQRGDELLLTGYGCTRPGGGGSDGLYRIGTANVIRLPGGTNNDIVTLGGAALCFGDSGGPAFKVQDAVRWLVGVNSRGNISTTSYLSATHTPQAVSFFTNWMQKTGAEICGITPNMLGCRGVRREPVEFELEEGDLKLSVVVQPDSPKAADAVKFALQVAIEEMVR